MKNKRKSVNSKYSSYQLKMLFENILSRELLDFSRKVDVGFEWVQMKNIFSFSISKEVIRLKINLSAVSRLSRRYEPQAVVFWCSSFAAAYLNETEEARKEMPDSYFRGLVMLNVIGDLYSGKKIRLYSPFSKKKCVDKSFCIRPVEVDMAIRALTKTLFVFENRLTSEEIDYAEKTLDSLLLYSKFPEIMYRKSTIPMHVLFHELEMVQALFEKNADIRNHFAILKNFPEKGLSAMTVEGLIQIYFDTEMEFFLETALRILCYSSEELPEGDSRYRKCLCEIAESLGKTSVRYMQETEETEQKLLKDNRQAVKNITMRINRLAEKYEMNFNIGTVHFLY